jgi:leucyl/phenylalanyl-tRNA---protein transferase
MAPRARSGPPVAETIALYAAGFFPMDDAASQREPLPFYAAQERAVFELDDASRAAVRRRVRRSLRAAAGLELARDRCFDEVLAGCASPRDPHDGVWITPRLADLYRRLHAAGAAHSLELHGADGLAAGILAVLLGRAAMLESMFHRVPDAGNALLARTLDDLAARGYMLCDIQLPSEHTTWLGARLIPRADYEERLRAALNSATGPSASWP